MTMNAGAKRKRLAGTAALLCALIASLAVAVVPAAAETGGGSELPVYSGSTWFAPIESSAGPEDYSWRVALGPGQKLSQASEKEALIEGTDGTSAPIIAVKAHDAEGTLVPTTLQVSEGDVVTLTVHLQEGDFEFPVTAEQPWLLISQGSVIALPIPIAEVEYSENQIIEANPPARITPRPPVPCAVPSLHGLTLRAAKARLRAAHCAVGKVHLATGATAAHGKVVKQFHPAGTQLAAGTPVAVELGSR